MIYTVKMVTNATNLYEVSQSQARITIWVMALASETEAILWGGDLKLTMSPDSVRVKL